MLQAVPWESSEWLERRLYAGTSNLNGCEVWRSGNGTSWTIVVTTGFSDSNNDHAYAMALHDDKLFVGSYNSYHGAEVWSSYTGGGWEPAGPNGFRDVENEAVLALANFGNDLYGGTMNSYGCEIWGTSLIFSDGFETGNTSAW